MMTVEDVYVQICKYTCPCSIIAPKIAGIAPVGEYMQVGDPAEEVNNRRRES
jgi:hypothetical protein